ncbi:MAG: hypothetical protein RXR52_13470 [Paraburkholderia sp.]
MTSWLHPRPLQLVTRVLRASLDSGVWHPRDFNADHDGSAI